MKKILFFFLVCFVLMSFMVNAFSINVDGIDSGIEWHDSTVYKLFQGESNSNINFGLVKVKFDNKNSAVYLCFMFIDPFLEQGNELCGLRFSVDGSSCFELYPSGSPVNNDIDKYSFDGAIYIDENNGATCEMRVGFKEGLPQVVSCDVQFVDSSGVPSNHYYIDIVNESYSRPTQLVVSPTADNDDPYYNSGLLTQKITKSKTTLVNTTKEKTEKSTTKRKYTTAKTTSTTEFVISEPPMIYTGRTKAPKTTEENSTIINNGVTVYYYEKEVIVSMVPVSVPMQIINESSFTELSVTVCESDSETIDTSVYVTDDNLVFSLSDGAKYKKASILIGAFAFIVIAVCSVYYFKKS